MATAIHQSQHLGGVADELHKKPDDVSLTPPRAIQPITWSVSNSYCETREMSLHGDIRPSLVAMTMFPISF